MKIPFLKFKREKLPSVESLHPPLFKSETMWFVSLGASLCVVLATAFIGARIFYSQYFESYKKSGPSENFENLINTNALKRAVEKRNEFIDREIALPRDPSL